MRCALVAVRHRATPVQAALAWVLRKVQLGLGSRQGGVVAIPKAARAVHLRHNWAAGSLTLGAADLAELDLAFVPPRRSLSML